MDNTHSPFWGDCNVFDARRCNQMDPLSYVDPFWIEQRYTLF